MQIPLPPARALAAAALCLGALPLSAQTFTIIGLPDTQNYSEFFPAIFTAQTQWVAANLSPRNIRYVAHYGDVVNDGDNLVQWANADQAMSVLDAAGVPYGVTAGNHDITPTGSSGQPYIPQFFKQFFGAQRFAGKSWYRGSSPSGMSSYQVFQAGGFEFLGLHLECDGALRELEWAQGILNQHRDKPVMMTTHRYLQDAEDYTAGVPLVPSGYYPPIWYTIEGKYVPDGIESTEFADWFVRRNPNVFWVNCGHFHEEFRQTLTNVEGRTVHEVLADYQDDPNGGDGWLRIMELDLAAKLVRVDSYSPTLNAFRSAAESKFSAPVDFAAFRENRPTVVLQEQIATHLGNTYIGTQDTWINQASPNTAYGQAETRDSDDDTTNSLFSDSRGQALIRFDGIVGPAGLGRVPAGAQVVRAHLTIQVVDDIDNPFLDPDFFLHRVQVPWSESSTWNSLGNGLSGSEIGPLLAVIEGDNNPNEDGLRRIDVTSTVQAWVDGQPNFGFAILPEIISGNDDGISIATSESKNPLLRPRLEIVYAFDCGYTPYGQGASPTNSLSLSGIGSPTLGGNVLCSVSPAPAGGAFTAWSLASGSLPILGGVALIDIGSLGGIVFTPNLSGEVVTSLPIPGGQNLPGLTLYLQAFASDASKPQGFAFSNGLACRLCP
jgi:hypothetical protein